LNVAKIINIFHRDGDVFRGERNGNWKLCSEQEFLWGVEKKPLKVWEDLSGEGGPCRRGEIKHTQYQLCWVLNPKAEFLSVAV